MVGSGSGFGHLLVTTTRLASSNRFNGNHLEAILFVYLRYSPRTDGPFFVDKFWILFFEQKQGNSVSQEVGPFEVFLWFGLSPPFSIFSISQICLFSWIHNQGWLYNYDILNVKNWHFVQFWNLYLFLFCNNVDIYRKDNLRYPWLVDIEILTRSRDRFEP